MLLPTTLCLAAAAALVNIWLVLRIGRLRTQFKVSVGDGGHDLLARRMRAQLNFVENVPLVVILTGLIEFSGKGGLKGAERFAGAQWITRRSGVPLLVGAPAAIDCAVEETLERHSHAIVIGRVLDVHASGKTAALAYWQGRYVAMDQDEDAARLAEVSLPLAHARAK